MDTQIFVSSMNVLVQFATIAYSMYYLTCFRQMMELAKGDESQAQPKEPIAVSTPVHDDDYPIWNEGSEDLNAQLNQPLLD